jgi:hypothetical protein
MKIILIVLLCLAALSCKTKPFVKHSLSFEKIGDRCEGGAASVSMNSNLNGERYELQSCLDADFKKEQITSYQLNDTTVVLKFIRKNSKQALYKLTIDVDAYPRYSLLILDEDTIHMKAVEP